MSYWKANGYNSLERESVSANAELDWSYMNPDSYGNVALTWGSAGAWPELDVLRDGYEVYAKLKPSENSTIKARFLQSQILMPWNMAWGNDQDELVRIRKSYIVYQNSKSFSENFNLESNVYADWTNNQWTYENNNLKIGTKAVKTDVGPNTDEVVNTGANTPVLATKSEEIESHDLQFYLKSGVSYAAVTFYKMLVNDFISVTSNGYSNFADVRSEGVELEGKLNISNKFSLYGNFTYTKAATPDKSTTDNAILLGDTDLGTVELSVSNDKDEVLNYPKYMYNLGVDFGISESMIFNVHLNGFMKMPIQAGYKMKDAGQYVELDGEMYLDAALNMENIAGLGFDVSIVVDNIFDNTDPIGLMSGGIWYPRGRNIGTSISYRF